jgi:hypothetical protein
MMFRRNPKDKEYWAEQERLWAILDEKTPVMKITWPDVLRLKCLVCGSGARFHFNNYAFSRPDPMRLIGCNCPKKIIWIEVVKPS